MSVMLCTEATFVKKNSYLVARINSFDTVGLHLLIVPFMPYLNQRLYVSQILKYDGNIVVT